MKEKAIFNWSGGKDSSLAMYRILQSRQYDVIYLLTTVSRQYRRICMHGVREELLHAQAQQMDIPLMKLELADMPTMQNYEHTMRVAMEQCITHGVTSAIFGDIFLQDLREYREQQLAEVNLKGVFPLWGGNTLDLMHQFISLDFKAIVTCVNEKYLDKSFSGRLLDENFLSDLPNNVDPCGEYGEFHTFVFDGPIFKRPIPFVKGEVVYRQYSPPPATTTSDKKEKNSHEDHERENPFTDGFWYCDLLSV